MTKEVALKILERHNDWRKGKEIPMLKPELIGQAIDKAIEVLRLSIVVGSEAEFCDCEQPISYLDDEGLDYCSGCGKTIK